jgi:glycerol-3-phosphate dehydrogenase
MKKFSQKLYPTVREETFFAPCGVADLIATCYGGRNRLVAMEYTRLRVVSMGVKHRGLLVVAAKKTLAQPDAAQCCGSSCA